MKRKLLVLFTILLMIPFFINASTFSDGSISANQYYNKFETYSRYLLIKDNLPFGYNGTIYNVSGFSRGGFVDHYEFVVTQRGKGNVYSWLNTGTKYWTLSNGNGGKLIVSNTKDETKPVSDNINTRAMVYVIPGTKVSGIGTYDNPWIFIATYQVKIDAGDHGSVDSDGQKSVIKPIENGGNVDVVVIPDDGYKYSSNTCGSEATYNPSTGKLIIANVIKDIDCKVEFEPSEAGRVLPTPAKTIKQVDGREETFKFTDPVPKNFYRLYNKGFYKDPEYSQVLTKINPIPKRKGWSFLGYYVNDKVLVDKDGNFTKDYTVLGDNDVITPRIVEHENYVTFDPGPGKLNGPEKETFLYDHYYNIPAPSRTGYHFRGWTITKGLDPTTAMTGSESSKITTPITSTAQKNMGPWFKNINPINATKVTFTANWEPITYKIEYDLGTPGNHAKYAPVIKTAPKTATYDKEFTVSNPTWEGNTFLGWTITGVEGTTKSTSFLNLAYIQDTVITFKANWSDTTNPYCKLAANNDNVYFGTIEDNTGIASSSINGVSGERVGAGIGHYVGVVTDTSGNSYTCEADLTGASSYQCNPYSCNPYSCNCWRRSYDCNCIDGISGADAHGHAYPIEICSTCTESGCNTCYETCYDTCYNCPNGGTLSGTRYCILHK